MVGVPCSVGWKDLEWERHTSGIEMQAFSEASLIQGRLTQGVGNQIQTSRPFSFEAGLLKGKKYFLNVRENKAGATSSSRFSLGDFSL